MYITLILLAALVLQAFMISTPILVWLLTATFWACLAFLFALSVATLSTMFFSWLGKVGEAIILISTLLAASYVTSMGQEFAGTVGWTGAVIGAGGLVYAAYGMKQACCN